MTHMPRIGEIGYRSRYGYIGTGKPVAMPGLRRNRRGLIACAMSTVVVAAVVWWQLGGKILTIMN